MSHSPGGTPAPAVDAQTAADVADLMTALAAPSRVLILDRLRQAPLPVGELALAVGMEQSAVSHQLRLLRHLGLVTGRRAGRRVFYALHDAHVHQLLDQAVAHVEHLRRGHADPIVLAGEAVA